jgi:hypothetical protein
LIPPLDKEVSGIITGSEEILKAFSSKHLLNTRVINDLIKDVLKNPAFNEVDHDMLKRLQKQILSFIQQLLRGMYHALWKRQGSNPGPWVPSGAL